MTANIALAETWLGLFVDKARPVFEEAGFPIPINLRTRVGLPSTGYRSNAIGECFAPEVSADGHYEIYISPKVSEGDARVADILSHELCHAAGSMNHDKRFSTLARAIGLEGPLRATTAGAGWFAWASPILDELGPMDFAALSADIQPRKKKATFLLKVECPDCGWLARVTKSHILPHSHLSCPTPDCDGILVCDLPDGSDTGE